MCLTTVVVVLAVCSNSSQNSNRNVWPNFRGPNCSGVADADQNPPILFGATKNVLWKTNLPAGHSSPCIWKDNIFITGYNEQGKQLKIYCINRKDGTIRWEKDISVMEFEQLNPLSNPATATPATDGERVYLYFSSYGILCYNFDGKLIWEQTLPVPKSRHGMGTSPVVTNDLVLLNLMGQSDDPHLIAINKYNGSTVWKYSLPRRDNYDGDSYSTPVIYKNQAIIYSSDEVAGYETKTGQRIWWFAIGVSDAVCTPVIGKDKIYTAGHSTYGNPEMTAQFLSFSEMATKYDKNRDSLIDKDEIKDFNFLMYPEKKEISPIFSITDFYWMWDNNNDGFINRREYNQTIVSAKSFYAKEGIKAIRLGGEGDVSVSNYLWNNPEQAAHVSSLLYYNGHVYMIRDGGIISCFDSESGKLVYREKSGATGAYFSSPVASDGRIMIASRNGIVTIFDSGDNFKILAQNNLEENITATPAIVDSKIYLRTAEFLYAFGER